MPLRWLAAAERRLPQVWLSRGAAARSLWPISALFLSLVRLQHMLYRWRWKRAASLPVPVVVVGNLVAGGAGKTPTVMAIVSLLREHGWAPGVISRGYGRESSEEDTVTDVVPGTLARQCGDEPLLLRLRLGVPVSVARSRVAAARELLKNHPDTNVLVSDDGLQHPQLPRNAQVIVFDERGAGNGWLLPAGPLREPMGAQEPARSVVVYNANRPTTPWPGHCGRRSLQGVVALADWWQGRAPQPAALQALRGATLLAAAGVARPERFFQQLRLAGLNFTSLPLPDHFDFAALPWPADTPDVVLTEKDAVKLQPSRIGTTRVWVAPLDFTLDAAFAADLLALLPSLPIKE